MNDHHLDPPDEPTCEECDEELEPGIDPETGKTVYGCPGCGFTHDPPDSDENATPIIKVKYVEDTRGDWSGSRKAEFHLPDGRVIEAEDEVCEHHDLEAFERLLGHLEECGILKTVEASLEDIEV